MTDEATLDEALRVQRGLYVFHDAVEAAFTAWLASKDADVEFVEGNYSLTVSVGGTQHRVVIPLKEP